MARATLKPRYQVINGVRCAAMFSPDCVKQAMAYQPQPTDIFIATYPKCGTTWMQNIALYIFRKGKELEDHKEFFRMCPFIDAFGSQGINLMPRPGAFKTHLPYNKIPYSPEAKYIIVLRNPKDCCISLFHHTKKSIGFGYWDAKLDDFFELFMNGEVEYDDYFDHLMAWYPHRNDQQIFFTTYEAMKKDTKDIVLKLARFLGDEYIETIEKDNNVLNNILHFSSFEYMKKNISELFNSRLLSEEELNNPNILEGVKHMVRYGMSLNRPLYATGKVQFLRKGVVGDWKNHLSEEQSARLSQKFLDRTQGTEIQEMYKDCIYF